MKNLALTLALKTVKDNDFVGVQLRSGNRALVVNATKGFHLIMDFEAGFPFIPNAYGGPQISIQRLLEDYRNGIKRVCLFETHRELFKWLSEIEP